MKPRRRHWRFKKGVSTVAMDLCSSTRYMRSRTESIVFAPEFPVQSKLVECEECRKIVAAEMPELLPV